MIASDTIDWGIDLGTTNSSIAIQQGTGVITLENSVGEDTTPSAVSVRDVGGRLVCEVGKKARQRLKDDPDSVALEFKQMMGIPAWSHKFPAASAAPAFELSAHVLAELVRSTSGRGNVPPVKAAIVGVPAAFKNQQYDDTKQAARKAGIEYVELLPEPVAAALAFAHKGDPTGHPLWLAYDLGGGTFDAALVRGDEGVFSVIDHEGDANLGGKHLDNAIVMKLIYPQLPAHIQKEVVPWSKTSKYWWILKVVAEEAKCALSTEPEALVEAELGKHHVGVWLSQADVNALQAEVFGRSLDVCRTLLKRNNYRLADVEKVLMIGGPTKSRYLRDMIEKGVPANGHGGAVMGLGIALDCSVDPLTAVAQGAALYAAGRRIPSGATTKPRDAQGVEMRVNLNYTPQVVEPDQLMSGTITPTGAVATAVAGCSVVMTRLDASGKASWQSPAIQVSEAGKFGRRLPLLDGENIFRLQVTDSTGRSLTIDREQFRIVKGIKTGQLTLPRGIGVADRFGLTRWIFRKGDALPDVQSDIFKTTVALEKGKAGKPLEIPIVEGSNSKAHLNSLIYTLRIGADDTEVTSKIPAGAEIEVELSIDESRQISMKARFVDYDIVITSDLTHRDLDVDALRKSFETAKADYRLFKKVGGQSPDVGRIVQTIEEAGLIDEIQTLLGHAGADNLEPATKAQDRLLELLQEMDAHQPAVNKLLEWEQHQAFCDRNMKKAVDIVAETPGITAAWKTDFGALQSRYTKAVQAMDFEASEHIAYSELPDLFKKSEALKARVGGGPVEREGAARIGGSGRKGDLE